MVKIRDDDYARLLIDSVSAIIVGLDLDGRITFFNRGAEVITGYQASEVLGQDWFELMVPRSAYPEVWQSFRRATAAGRLTEYDENPVRTAGGTERVVLWRNTPLEANGRMLGTLSFGLDITERRDAESRARAWESQFRRFIEAAPDSIGVLRARRYVYANPRMAAMLGHDHPSELIGREIFEFLAPEDHERFRRRGEAVLAGERPGPATYSMRRRDGRAVTVECTAIAVEFEGGPAMLGLGRDVTERERLQAQLIASERMASLGVLTAGIAHEINNPLTYLALNLDMLDRLMPLARRDPTQLAQVELRLAEVRDAAERVSAIVRDLRAFSRPPDDDRTLVDFGEIIRSGLKLVHNELHHRAHVEVEMRESPPVVADAGRLAQVVVALVTNALQALPQSRGDQAWVRVRMGEEDGGAVLTVTDSGPGIPPAIAGRIFEPFFTSKPVGEGTGLGLSIAHGIVRSFGGTIRVDSRPGETTFRVWLPAASAASPQPARSPRPSPAATGALKILVVDDEVLIGAAVRSALSPPHDVEVVTSAEEALEPALAGHHDLVLCDLMMPGMTGMDLYNQVKQREPQLARRFVFMTGGAFTRRANEFLEDDLPRIEKPFDLEDLARLLRRPLT